MKIILNFGYRTAWNIKMLWVFKCVYSTKTCASNLDGGTPPPSRLARGFDIVHPPFHKLLDFRCTLLNQLSQGQFARVLSDVIIVIAKDQLVRIDASHPTLDALGHDAWWELVRAMKDDLYLATRLLIDTL